jgi:hypothetical protein
MSFLQELAFFFILGFQICQMMKHHWISQRLAGGIDLAEAERISRQEWAYAIRHGLLIWAIVVVLILIM